MSQNDPWDDWEQADDAGIEVPSLPIAPSKSVAAPQQPIRILQRPASRQIAEREEADARLVEENNKALWSKANAFQTPVIERTDTTRTEYVPEISILRRPKGPSTIVAPRPSPTMKPFAEREAEYKAAREKIFGPTASSSTPSPLSSPSRTPPIDNGKNDSLPAQDRGGGKIHFSGVQPSYQMRPTRVMDTAMRQPRGPPSPGSGLEPSSQSSRGRGGTGHSSRGGGRFSTSSPTPKGPGVSSPETNGSRGFHKPIRGRPQGHLPPSNVS